MSNLIPQRAKSASTIEEQDQPLENAVSSSACSSLFMSEHHHFREEKKEKKEHDFRDVNKKDTKHTPTHKDNGKDHHKQEKAERSAHSKITIPKDKFIWTSTLESLAGIGPKIEIQIDRPQRRQGSISQPQAKDSKSRTVRGGWQFQYHHLRPSWLQ
jgi:hypothetical protein